MISRCMPYLRQIYINGCGIYSSSKRVISSEVNLTDNDETASSICLIFVEPIIGAGPLLFVATMQVQFAHAKFPC